MRETALSRQFGTAALLRFALPNIAMMVFLSLYTIVDGIFISRYVGTLALSAVNMSYPLNSLEMALGIMLGTGGSAIIARELGEEKERRARGDFTAVVAVSLVLGILCMAAGLVFLDPLLRLLGASDAQFQLGVTVAGGVANVVLDMLFMGPLGLGVAGAAVATGIGYCIPAVAGTVYFFKNRTGALWFTPFRLRWRMLLQTCWNGSSEMVSNVANAVTTFLFNVLFLAYWGEDGVASITIVMYFQFVFSAMYLGFSMGVAPVVSFKYGAQDREQLQKIFRSCGIFILLCSGAMYLLSRIVIGPCLSVFTDPGSRVYAITMEGFPIYAAAFWFMGANIFASSLFTALSDGAVSAAISFARTFLFLVSMLLILPQWLGAWGIWLAVPAAEALGLVVSAAFILWGRRKYGYAPCRGV